MARGDYWRDLGVKTHDFWNGVREGIKAYAVWKDGDQLVGIMRTPIQEVFDEIQEVVDQSNDAEIDSDRRKKFEEMLDYLIHSTGGLPFDEDEDMERHMNGILQLFGLKLNAEE